MFGHPPKASVSGKCQVQIQGIHTLGFTSNNLDESVPETTCNGTQGLPSWELCLQAA